MKKRTGNEVKPPYLGGKRAFNAKIKPADFRQQNIQINRKPRIPFEKIENPFDPDFMIKLPDNTEISAADYYQELNQLEEAFNRDGYSLNPDKQKEREIVYAKVPSAVKSAAAGASVKADQKVPVKQIEPIRQTYLQRMASARQSLRSTQSTGVMQRVPETRTGLKVKSNPYQRMLHSSTEGGKPFYLSAFMNGWSDLYADMEKSHIKHNAEFGVWIFGNQIKILDLVGSTQTSYSGGQLVTEMTGNLWQLNNIPIPKEKRNVPTVPPEDMSALPEIPPVEQSFSLYDIDQCFETRFIVGPVPVYFRVGVSGEAGVHCTMGASPVFASNFCDFWVVADAYAQAAVQFPGKDIVIPTVTCDLTFIDSHLYMNGMIEREGEKITSEYYIDKMSMMCYGLFYLHTTVFVLTPIGLGYGYIPFVFVTQVASLPGDLEIDMLSERYSDRWPLQVKAVE